MAVPGGVRVRTRIIPDNASLIQENGDVILKMPTGGDSVGFMITTQSPIWVSGVVSNIDGGRIRWRNWFTEDRWTQVGTAPICETYQANLLANTVQQIFNSAQATGLGKLAALEGTQEDGLDQAYSQFDLCKQVITPMIEPFLSGTMLPLFAISPQCAFRFKTTTFDIAFQRLGASPITFSTLDVYMDLEQSVEPMRVRQAVKEYIDANGQMYFNGKVYLHHVISVITPSGTNVIPLPFQFRSVSDIIIAPYSVDTLNLDYRNASHPMSVRRPFCDAWYLNAGNTRYPQRDLEVFSDTSDPLWTSNSYADLMKAAEVLNASGVEIPSFTDAVMSNVANDAPASGSDTDVVGAYCEIIQLAPTAEHGDMMTSGLNTIGLQPFQLTTRYYTPAGRSKALTLELHMWACLNYLFQLNAYGFLGSTDLFF